MNGYSYYGYSDFILSLGYKVEVIKEYFYNYNAYSNDYTINLSTKKISYHRKHDELDWNVSLINTGVDKERDLAHLNKLWDEGNSFWKVWE